MNANMNRTPTHILALGSSTALALELNAAMESATAQADYLAMWGYAWVALPTFVSADVASRPARPLHVTRATVSDVGAMAGFRVKAVR